MTHMLFCAWYRAPAAEDQDRSSAISYSAPASHEADGWPPVSVQCQITRLCTALAVAAVVITSQPVSGTSHPQCWEEGHCKRTNASVVAGRRVLAMHCALRFSPLIDTPTAVLFARPS